MFVIGFFYSKRQVLFNPVGEISLGGGAMATSDEGVFAISVAARMSSMEIQNLRVYERRGLVDPDRTPGGTRLYSETDVARLVRIGQLLAEGLNLAGIARVVELEAQVAELRTENARLREARGR
jgi:MerR family transcriptional regulator, heat shock protein HspR